ncbi:MAG TPA: ABC transporter permease [Acidobacteriaceae bacterium]|jgi:predicted permease|nr:ABC transporter permease [Acidobacteriaceae bacterium]
MSLLTSLRSLTAKFFRSSATADDLDEELRSHIQHRADDLQRSGLSRAEAERRARIEFGAYEKFREESHQALGGNFFDVLTRDIHFALRVLRKSPGFTITAVLTLTLAIGANAVVFGVLNAVILRPLHVPQPSTLWGLEHEDDYGFQSYPNYLDLRDRNRTFQGLAVFSINQETLDTGRNPSIGWAYEISGNYFDVLRIQPCLGRFFHSSDEHGPNSAPYIVLSYPYWHAHFSGDRSVIGRVVQINKHLLTIIGVAPPTFNGTMLFFTPDFFFPLVEQPLIDGWNGLEGRGNRWLFEAFGHLRPGVTPAQASTDLNAIGAYLEKTYPRDVSKKQYSLARPSLYGNFLGRPVRAFVAGLMLLSGLILLAACANLGSLFAARASDRSREVALRLALGSSRNRILRQLMTEAILISLAGGALGLAGSIALLNRLNSWLPFNQYPIHIPVSPDARVYLVALGLALLSGFLFGLVPVRQVLRADPYQIVKAGSSVTPGRRLFTRDVLLVIQIALCAVLVTSSLVAVRGLIRSLNADYGFQPRNALIVDVNLAFAGYTGDNVPPMQKRMLDAVQAVPGVQAVATVSTPPLGMGNGERRNIYKDDSADLRASKSAALPFLYVVSPNYFTAAGTALLAGRSFTAHDDMHTPRLAIVNQEFAQTILNSSNPTDALGRYFRLDDGTRLQVVGVAENGKYLNLAESQQPAFFLPLFQILWSEMSMVVRTNRDPQQAASAVRTALHTLDPGLPVEVNTWNRDLDGVLFPSRVATIALGVLGIMGAILSITGIFGMAAWSVSRRLRELGIRMALGAQRREVLSAALGRALRLLAIGSAAGLLLGILATRVLAFIVYQASARDPLVLAGVVFAMAALGLIATWIPAQRALSLDPLLLLHEE